MIKELLENKHISVYKCAKEAGIPYTTLNELILNKKNIMDCSIKTIQSLANYLNVPMEKIISSSVNDNKTFIASDWEEMKNKTFIFPVMIDNPNYHAERVHPLVQKKVNDIVNYLSTKKNIKKVYLFGSSTNIRCNNKSDLDFAIELDDYDLGIKNQVSDEIGKRCDYNFDIIWMNSINDNHHLLDNIMKGIIIYE